MQILTLNFCKQRRGLLDPWQQYQQEKPEQDVHTFEHHFLVPQIRGRRERKRKVETMTKRSVAVWNSFGDDKIFVSPCKKKYTWISLKSTDNLFILTNQHLS